MRPDATCRLQNLTDVTALRLRRRASGPRGATLPRQDACRGKSARRRRSLREAGSERIPAAAVGVERPAGRQVGDDDEPTLGEALGGEVEEGPVLARRPEAAAEGAGPLPARDAGQEGELASVLGDDAHVLSQADGEGNVVVVEEFQPLGADELPVGEQDRDRGGREMREVALQQGDARGHRAGALPRQHRPEQRHAEAARHHREHEVVHLARSDRPVRPVEREGPSPRRPDQPDEERQRPVLAEAHVLEEPQQPPTGRRPLHASAPCAGDVAEVHRPRVDHPHEEQAERLHAALAHRHMRAHKAFESGDGSVRHPDVSLVGVVQKITSSRSQPPTVV